MAAVVSTLIQLDERGVAWITGTKVKVIEVATDKLAHGSSPEEMHFQYPHLSLAQIYAALAYYYAHQAEFEAEILRQAERAKAWAEAANDSAYTAADQGVRLVAIGSVTLIERETVNAYETHRDKNEAHPRHYYQGLRRGPIRRCRAARAGTPRRSAFGQCDYDGDVLGKSGGASSSSSRAAQERAGYGEQLLERLADDLTKRFGRGVSRQQSAAAVAQFYLSLASRLNSADSVWRI